MPDQEIIDVLIVIDAETTLSTYGPNGDSKNPTQITNSNLIYMITKQAEVVSGNAGNELNISAETLDVIRWRETTLSLNADYDAILYSFVAAAGGTLISTPEPLLVTVSTPLPNPADPLHPTTQTVQSYFWSCTVLNQGDVTYNFKFMIVDRHGAVQGYYSWDPFIHITD
jgi:nematocidal protein AidA